MNRVLITLAVFLVMSIGENFAAAVPADDDEGPPDFIFTCELTDDGAEAHVRCTCSGTDQCDQMAESGVCDRLVEGRDGSMHTVNDTDCPKEYRDNGELVCHCTSLSDTSGVSTRPDSHDPSTENAPRDDVSSTGTPAIFAAPTRLRVRPAGGNRLAFVWQDNSNNERAFVIERLLPMTSAWTTIATVSGPGGDMGRRTHLAEIQGARVSFCYRVRATRGTITTAPTETVCSGLD